MRRQLISGGVYFLALSGRQYQVLPLPDAQEGITHVLKPLFPGADIADTLVIRDGLINGEQYFDADTWLDFSGRVIR